MLFNSLEYIFVFLPLAVLVFYAANRFISFSAGKVWLILCSIAFYGYTSVQWVPLLCGSIFLNYITGILLQKRHLAAENKYGSSIILWSGICTNLLLLGYFKYSNFFISTVNSATHSSHALLSITLPLAISFYTFQQISFIVDCYRNKTKQSSFQDYLVFVLFFPQLTAGPILRWDEIAPQLTQKNCIPVHWHNLSTGIYVFSIGLFKKVIIADTFSIWATPSLDFTRNIGFVESWLASLSYTFQLYYDFSGYTDMAIGAALLFNIKLPINFNSPYLASSIQDFWRRWHITLSRWLRDYLYIPLGGNRHGSVMTMFNIFITFLLAGLWHGAGWTFIVWGSLHGSALIIHRLWKELGLKLNIFTAWLCTFLFVNFSWVYFSAPGIQEANSVIKSMLGFNQDQPVLREITATLFSEELLNLASLETMQIWALIIFAVSTFLIPNTMKLINFVQYNGLHKFKPTLWHATLMSFFFFLATLSFIGNVSKTDFIYFQF